MGQFRAVAAGIEVGQPDSAMRRAPPSAPRHHFRRCLARIVFSGSKVCRKIWGSGRSRQASASARRRRARLDGCRGQAGAGARQIADQQRPRVRWRRMARLGGKPPGELLAAAVAGRRRGLIMAFRLACRAGQAQMEMRGVPPPRPDLVEPRRSAPASRHRARLIAGLTNIRAHLRLARERFEQRRSAAVHTAGLTCSPSRATT